MLDSAVPTRIVRRMPYVAMTCLVTGATRMMPSACTATLTPIHHPDTPINCIRRFKRCIERLVAKPTSAAARMKGTTEVDRSPARVSSPTAVLAAGGTNRGRNASQGGDDASSMRIWLAALMAGGGLLSARLFGPPNDYAEIPAKA